VYRENESRFVWFGFDLLPQVDNVGINRPSGGKAVISPDFLKQTVAAQGFALVTKEVFEQIEFLGREIKRFTATQDLATTQIYFNVAK